MPLGHMWLQKMTLSVDSLLFARGRVIVESCISSSGQIMLQTKGDHYLSMLCYEIMVSPLIVQKLQSIIFMLVYTPSMASSNA